MATEFKLPNWARTSLRATSSVCWSPPATRSTKDQPVLELETDKATIEVPSSVSGTVAEVQGQAGRRVKVGQVVLTVDGGAKAPKAEKTEAEAQDRREAGNAEGRCTCFVGKRRGRHRAG